MTINLSWKNNNLKELLKRRGITQAEFAEELKITQGSLNHYIKNIRQPNLDMICNMCNILGLEKIDDLFKKE